MPEPLRRDGFFEDNVAQAEGNVKFSLKGANKHGIEVYETSGEVKGLTRAERKKRFLDLMTDEYRGRTAKFIRNGHAYYARFTKDDAKKTIYGDKKSDRVGQKAKINVGADGEIFELVENATYHGSSRESGKNTAAHKGVRYWDYFVKKVQVDGHVFDLVANVRRLKDGEYVYSIQMNEDKKTEAAPPMTYSERDVLPRAATASEASVARKGENVKFSLVKKPETLKFLENQKHVKVYRAMQEIDGKLYPPMAAKIKGENGKKQLVEPTKVGAWYQADERPDLIKLDKSGKPKFELNKGNGGMVPAAYNPYFHTSATPLNDQFPSSYNRPDLFVAPLVGSVG